jgi:hypothetical protein
MMNDKIYKKKYLKYKKKYLILKDQLGGDSNNIIHSGFNKLNFIINYIYSNIKNNFTDKNLKNNFTNYQTTKKFIKFIGNGSFGCIISPPLILTNIVKQDFPNDDTIKIDIDILDNEYVAKILSCKNKVYKKEYDSNMLIKAFDENGNHTPQMIFAGYMNRPDLIQYIKTQKNIENQELKKLYSCLDIKLAKNYHKYYGYIITKNVGTSFNNLPNIDKQNIIPILKSLKDGIDTFITKLYKAEYIHGDIKFPNITLKDNKVYFIDFGFMHNYTDKIINYGYSNDFHYPIVLKQFYKIYYAYTTNKIKKIIKQELINSLIKNLITYYNKNTYHDSMSLKFLFETSSNQDKQMNEYYDELFKTLEDNTLNLEQIYTTYIKPIAQNSDIHALSLFIYDLFFGIDYDNIKAGQFVNEDTKNLVKKLLKHAIYNRIEGPKGLSERLDEIIKSIQ